MENRHGLAVGGAVSAATGTAERASSEALRRARQGRPPPHHGGRGQSL
jgi:hypothetical protein